MGFYTVTHAHLWVFRFYLMARESGTSEIPEGLHERRRDRDWENPTEIKPRDFKSLLIHQSCLEVKIILFLLAFSTLSFSRTKDYAKRGAHPALCIMYLVESEMNFALVGMLNAGRNRVSQSK